MVLMRAFRAALVLAGSCLPVIVLWLLLALAIDKQNAAQPHTPNPSPAPARMLGLLDMLAYADPYLAGMAHLWLAPAGILLLVLFLWAAGVPVFVKEAPAGWPMPGMRKVVLVSLAAGLFLALPWIYVLIRVLAGPPPWAPGPVP